MQTRACAFSLLIALAPTTLATSPLLAQAGAGDAMTDMARQRFQEGVKAYDAKKYDQARVAFLQAYALKHHPAVLLNLAQSELRSAHPVEAARHFAAYLRENPSAAGLERADAEKGLTEARAKVGRVAIGVNVTGADVYVDGELVGRSPLSEPVDVAPGNHAIEVKHSGHSAGTTVTATVGRVVSAALNIEGNAPLPIVAPLPGSSAAPAPVSPLQPPPDATQPSGQAQPLEAQPSSAAIDTSTAFSGKREPFLVWARHSKLAWGGAALTGVGVVTAVGFAIAAKNNDNNANDLNDQITQRWEQNYDNARVLRPDGHVCGPPAVTPRYETACNSLKDGLDARDRDKTWATIGLVAAGVGVVGTTAAYFLTAKKVDDGAAPVAPPTAVVPVIGPHFSGLALSASF